MQTVRNPINAKTLKSRSKRAPLETTNAQPSSLPWFVKWQMRTRVEKQRKIQKCGRNRNKNGKKNYSVRKAVPAVSWLA
jgi:hypothetical protein